MSTVSVFDLIYIYFLNLDFLPRPLTFPFFFFRYNPPHPQTCFSSSSIQSGFLNALYCPRSSRPAPVFLMEAQSSCMLPHLIFAPWSTAGVILSDGLFRCKCVEWAGPSVLLGNVCTLASPSQLHSLSAAHLAPFLFTGNHASYSVEPRR